MLICFRYIAMVFRQFCMPVLLRKLFQVLGACVFYGKSIASTILYFITLAGSKIRRQTVRSAFSVQLIF